MNFCDKFFDNSGVVGKAIVDTSAAVAICFDNTQTLDLRGAQFTKSAVILHECTYSDYVMGDLGL